MTLPQHKIDAAYRARASHLEEQRRHFQEESDPHAGARHLATAVAALAATIAAGQAPHSAPVALALAPAPEAPREPTLAEFLESRRQASARAARSRARAEAQAQAARDEAWMRSAADAQRARKIEAQRAAAAIEREARAEADREAARKQSVIDDRQALRDRVLGTTRLEIADRTSQQKFDQDRAELGALFAAAADPQLEAQRKAKMQKTGLRLGF